MIEPFALTLYRHYAAGESLAQLALRFQIPMDRIEARIRAAQAFLNQQKTAPTRVSA